MLSVEMMPAGRGDAVLVEYGPSNTATNRLLIDGGPVNSGLYDGIRARLAQIPVDEHGCRRLDLLIVTHIDTDHVEGVIRLLQDDELALRFDDIWFNGWEHVSQIQDGDRPNVLGGLQGEFLGALLTEHDLPWNRAFGGGPVFMVDDLRLPQRALAGGMALTILSPNVKKLHDLADEWSEAVKDAGFVPGASDKVRAALAGKWWARPHVLGDSATRRRSKDNSKANGSSIAVMAEYGGRSVLLAGDAHFDIMTTSLRQLQLDRGTTEPLHVDAYKIPHHGSRKNLSEQMLATIDPRHYLVSTNGKRFSHPDPDAIKQLRDRHRGERLPVFCFNYDVDTTEKYRGRPGLEARYGPDAIVRLSTDD